MLPVRVPRRPILYKAVPVKLARSPRTEPLPLGRSVRPGFSSAACRPLRRGTDGGRRERREDTGDD